MQVGVNGSERGCHKARRSLKISERRPINVDHFLFLVIPDVAIVTENDVPVVDGFARIEFLSPCGPGTNASDGLGPHPIESGTGWPHYLGGR
jgi:hypothetical protein